MFAAHEENMTITETDSISTKQNDVTFEVG
jgi:hypothetical protein